MRIAEKMDRWRRGSYGRRVVVDEQVLDGLRDHVEGCRDEWGGLLLGFERGGDVAYTMAACPPQLEQSPTFCNFSAAHRAALEIALWQLRLGRVLSRIDWIHTHPGLGVFLSGTDRDTFDRFRAERCDLLALVFDPVADDLRWFADPQARPAPVSVERVVLTSEERFAMRAAELALRVSGVDHIFMGATAALDVSGDPLVRLLHYTLERAKDHVQSELAGRVSVEALGQLDRSLRRDVTDCRSEIDALREELRDACATVGHLSGRLEAAQRELAVLGRSELHDLEEPQECVPGDGELPEQAPVPDCSPRSRE